MPTYIGNCYEILSQVRYGINEYSDNKVKGTDATGAFLNAELMRYINNAQSYIWSVLFEQMPEIFLKNEDLSFVESEATLPTDCFKIREVLDSELHNLTPVNIGQRLTGSRYQYYRYGNTVKIDYGTEISGLWEEDPDGALTPSVTETGSIWYYTKCRDLDSGMTSAGGALSATLATTASKVADYYNNMTIEDITGDAVDTITDYSTARVATVSNTWAASRYYGIVSELPAVFHPLIAEYAILQLKKNPKVPLAVSIADIQLFSQMFQSAIKSYAGTSHTDQTIGSLYEQFYSRG